MLSVDFQTLYFMMYQPDFIRRNQSENHLIYLIVWPQAVIWLPV